MVLGSASSVGTGEAGPIVKSLKRVRIPPHSTRTNERTHGHVDSDTNSQT